MRKSSPTVRGSGPRVRGSEGSAPFLFPSSKVSLKTGYRADSAARERIERRPLHFIDVVAIPRIADVVTALVQRAAGNIEKAGELDVRSPPESFRDIGRRRRNGRSDLIAELSIRLDVCSLD